MEVQNEMPACEIVGLGTHVKVADIEKSRKFYESLGFKPVFAYGDDAWRSSLPEGVPSAPERYRGMTFKVGEHAEFEIAEGHVGVKDRNVFHETIASAKVSALVRVKSIVPLFTNPLVTVTFPVRHYYWGTIEAAFRDPDGFVLVFVASYSEDEFRQVSKHRKIEVIKAAG